MSLYEKIMKIHPSLKEEDFNTVITLQNDSDDKGDYIAEWNHKTLKQPTQSELDAVE